MRHFSVFSSVKWDHSETCPVGSSGGVNKRAAGRTALRLVSAIQHVHSKSSLLTRAATSAFKESCLLLSLCSKAQGD